ncbi:MAG: hypothetical protein GX493_08230 [Firmicutes bacterium]|nr:hypothetical protein [Bacillota bacterium]
MSAMPEPLLRQFSSFTLFLLGGVALGFAYDLLGALRRALRPRGVSSFFLDFAYGAVAFVVVFPLIVLGTWGELRFFVWLGLGSGAAYYRLFLHPAGAPLARRLIAPLPAFRSRRAQVPCSIRRPTVGRARTKRR